ncbi:MAG TPA: hypothetical protein VHP32_07420 [Ignavibacteria bacterium]|nr:hypothetical protein [Ignavibacteria bacterium]
MKRALLVKFISILVNVTAGSIFLIPFLIYRQSFGFSDIMSFAFSTIPLALSVSITGDKFLSFSQKLLSGLRFFIAIFIGLILGFVWTYIVYFILGYLFAAISIPILYLWIIGSAAQLVFLQKFSDFSRIKNKKRSLVLGAIFFPVIPTFIFSLLYGISFLLMYLNKPEAEIYLIPKGYTGHIYLVHDLQNGDPEEYENGKRIYRIPSSGVLFTKFIDEPGIITNDFYYIDSTGNRTEIKKKLTFADESENDTIPAIIASTIGSKSGAPNYIEYKYSYNFLGTSEQRREIDEIKITYLDSLRNQQILKNSINNE